MKEQLIAAVQAMIDNDDALTSQFPNVELAFQRFLTDNKLTIDFRTKLTRPLYIDDDGYPSMKCEVRIPTLALMIPLDITHHSEWEFNFEPIRTLTEVSAMSSREKAAWFQSVSHKLPPSLVADFNAWNGQTDELGDIYDQAEQYLAQQQCVN